MKKTPIVLLAAGLLMVGLLPAAVADDISLSDFLQSLEGRQGAERAAIFKALTDDQRRQLHEQFRALPDAERAAADAVLRPGRGQARPKGPTRAIGTVAYDGGVANPFRVNNGNVVGNRFNTGFGNPHTLTTVTIQFNGTFGGNDVEIFGAPVGSTAPQLASFTGGAPGIGTPVQLPLPTPITNMSGTFMAGADQSGVSTTPSTTFVNVAVDVNDAGFGFHGMSIATGGGGGFNPSPVVFNGSTSVPFNAIVRMTGENLPVELMSFEVD